MFLHTNTHMQTLSHTFPFTYIHSLTHTRTRSFTCAPPVAPPHTLMYTHLSFSYIHIHTFTLFFYLTHPLPVSLAHKKTTIKVSKMKYQFSHAVKFHALLMNVTDQCMHVCSSIVFLFLFILSVSLSVCLSVFPSLSGVTNECWTFEMLMTFLKVTDNSMTSFRVSL